MKDWFNHPRRSDDLADYNSWLFCDRGFHDWSELGGGGQDVQYVAPDAKNSHI